MAVSISSNTSVLRALRRLNESTASLGTVFSRLSSGLRITRASDDAAGLAIASQLSSSSRVYTQALRNTNDAISALNIADGALGELSDVLIRLRELATSSANGTLSVTQRRSLDAEALQLQKEFNRITTATQFNGLSLIDGRFGNMVIQQGYGVQQTLQFEVGDEFARNISTLSYSLAGTFSPPAPQDSDQPLAMDLNNDGFDDFVGSGEVWLSNGDGTFRQTDSVNGGQRPVAGDFNGDGKIDLIITTSFPGSTEIHLGNGDGTFVSSGISVSEIAKAAADFNGDGKLDLVSYGSNSTHVYLGNGNGTFQAAKSFTSTGALDQIGVGDINNDGRIDILTSNSSGTLSVRLGNGNGTFGAAGTISPGGGGGFLRSAQLADFNHDGVLDIVTSSSALTQGTWILLGNGDGTFKTESKIINSGSSGEHIVDANGDGILDIATLGGIRIGNGDGTFQTATGTPSFAAGTMPLGDFNGDGALDYFSFDDFLGTTEVYLANTSKSSELQRLNLLTRQGALDSLGIIDEALTRLQNERGSLGAVLSRLQSSSSTLSQTGLNYDAARGRIESADIAAESAALSRITILQQAAQSVLAQANQLPTLALQLLRP